MEKNEKKNKNCTYDMVKIGFWCMLGLFVVMLASTLLSAKWPALGIVGLIAGIFFIMSVFFVLVTSIMVIFPEKSLAYVALVIAILFVLYILLSAGGAGSSVL